MAAESASVRNEGKPCEDSTKVVVHAELEAAMLQLWERVDAELHVMHTAIRSMNGIDIDLLAVMNSFRSEAARAHYGLSVGNSLVHSRENSTSNKVDSVNIVETVTELKNETHKQEASVTHKGKVDDPPFQAFSSANFHRLVSQDKGLYVWSNTLWDVCIFAGTSPLGFGGSVIVVALIVLAVFSQSVYIFIIMELFANKTLSDEYLSGLRRWRSLTAHDARYMNDLSETSLASRVCEFDSSLELATGQTAIAQSIHVFLEGGLVHGPTVSLLAIGIFVTAICAEVRQSMILMASLSELVVSPSQTRISFSDKIRFLSISRSRFVFMLLLTTVRIAIAIGLACGSVNYLMQLADIQTIFLMSMKFLFVLNVEQLFFQAFLPRSVKLMMTHSAPLHSRYVKKAEKRCFGAFDVVSFICISCGVLSLCLVQYLGIGITQEKLLFLQEAMCGGNKHFVYTVNPTDGVLEWAVTGDGNVARSSFLEATVNELVQMRNTNLQFSLDGEASMSRKSSLQRVMELRNMVPGQDGTDSYNGCVDRLDWEGNWKDAEHSGYHRLRAALSAVLGHDVTSCQNVSMSICDQKHTPQVRALCPVRCGCGNFVSGLYLNSPEHGCNQACFTSGTYNSHMENFTCVDMTKEKLQQSYQWSRYWNGYAQSDPEAFALATPLALAHGCQFVSLIEGLGLHFCGGHQSGSPLRAFCPETCGCMEFAQSAFACPPSCSRFAELQSNRTFKYDCNDVPALVPAEGAREECNFLVAGTIVYTDESIEPQCCAAANQVMNDLITQGMFNDESSELACCLPGCFREMDETSPVRILLAELMNSDICYA